EHAAKCRDRLQAQARARAGARRQVQVHGLHAGGAGALAARVGSDLEGANAVREPTAEVIDFDAARREIERRDTEPVPPVRYLWTCECGGHLFALTRRQI